MTMFLKAEKFDCHTHENSPKSIDKRKGRDSKAKNRGTRRSNAIMTPVATPFINVLLSCFFPTFNIFYPSIINLAISSGNFFDKSNGE